MITNLRKRIGRPRATFQKADSDKDFDDLGSLSSEHTNPAKEETKAKEETPAKDKKTTSSKDKEKEKKTSKKKKKKKAKKSKESEEKLPPDNSAPEPDTSKDDDSSSMSQVDEVEGNCASFSDMYGYEPQQYEEDKETTESTDEDTTSPESHRLRRYSMDSACISIMSIEQSAVGDDVNEDHGPITAVQFCVPQIDPLAMNKDDDESDKKTQSRSRPAPRRGLNGRCSLRGRRHSMSSTPSSRSLDEGKKMPQESVESSTVSVQSCDYPVIESKTDKSSDEITDAPQTLGSAHSSDSPSNSVDSASFEGSAVARQPRRGGRPSMDGSVLSQESIAFSISDASTDAADRPSLPSQPSFRRSRRFSMDGSGLSRQLSSCSISCSISEDSVDDENARPSLTSQSSIRRSRRFSMDGSGLSRQLSSCSISCSISEDSVDDENARPSLTSQSSIRRSRRFSMDGSGLSRQLSSCSISVDSADSNNDPSAPSERSISRQPSIRRSRRFSTNGGSASQDLSGHSTSGKIIAASSVAATNTLLSSSRHDSTKGSTTARGVNSRGRRTPRRASSGPVSVNMLQYSSSNPIASVAAASVSGASGLSTSSSHSRSSSFRRSLPRRTRSGDIDRNRLQPSGVSGSTPVSVLQGYSKQLLDDMDDSNSSSEESFA